MGEHSFIVEKLLFICLGPQYYLLVYPFVYILSPVYPFVHILGPQYLYDDTVFYCL